MHNPRSISKQSKSEIVQAIARIGQAYGFKFTAEHRVCTSRRWRHDLYEPTYKIAIEYEGGIFSPTAPALFKIISTLKKNWGHFCTHPSLYIKQVQNLVKFASIKSGHTTGAGYHSDIEKYNEAQFQKTFLLRFDSGHFREVGYIHECFKRLREIYITGETNGGTDRS